jgi:hypothetical protein
VILALVRSKCGSRIEKSSSASTVPTVSDQFTASASFAVESAVPRGMMWRISLPYRVNGCTVVSAGGVVGVSIEFLDEFVSCFTSGLLRKLLLPPPALPGRDGDDPAAVSPLSVLASVPKLIAMRLALPSTRAPSSDAQLAG